jgi:hypothetical protein
MYTDTDYSICIYTWRVPLAKKVPLLALVSTYLAPSSSVAEPELFFAAPAPAPTFQKASAPLRLRLRLRCYMLSDIF